MMSTTLIYTYKYPFESALLEGKAEPTMRWATSHEGTSDDLFFDGKLRRPALIGQCLNVLTEIVRTRFYQSLDPKVLDPVVTSGGGMLRFEGFSSCCGVYARVDLSPAAFDVELRGKRTTNVDFSNVMRTSLRKLTDRQEARLQVGGDVRPIRLVFPGPCRHLQTSAITASLRGTRHSSHVARCS